LFRCRVAYNCVPPQSGGAECERLKMGSFFEALWCRAADAPSQTMDWLNSLSREEWLVVLVVVCAFGFISLLGFQSRRL
jgi:hypothetical protein